MKQTRLIKISVSVLMIMALALGYGTAYASTAQASGQTWTVLVYLCGTDLESEGGMATANIEELLSVDTPGGINVVVQTGGTAEWQNNLVGSDSLQRWVIAGGDIALVDEQPLASMGDANTLGEFLHWGVTAYPADKYMVVLWDHGGGAVAGVAFDELYDNDSLTLNELVDGVAMAGVRFEVIGFDACLMATLETAAAMADYGNYMVASEETEAGGGWDYAAWLNYMSDHPDTDGVGLGTVICDSFLAKCIREGEGELVTLSVVDLAAVVGLLTKFDALAAEMSGLTSDITKYQAFVRGVNRAENYGGNNPKEGYTNMLDLGDLAINTESVLSDTALSLLDALFETVKYNVKSPLRSQANGLAVYYPLKPDGDELTAYAQTAATSGTYLRFIQAISNIDWAPPQGTSADAVEAVPQTLSQDDYDIRLTTYITDDAFYALEISGELDAVDSVTFEIYYLDYDYSEYILLGTDNNIVADWETGYFEDNFNAEWAALDGYFCAPILIAEGEDYNLYTIPILLNGEETFLRAAYVWDDDENGHYEVYGAWDGIGDDGSSARDIVQLQDGDEITLLFDAINWETGEQYTYEMDSFIVSGDVVMEDAELMDGEYEYNYIVTDLFGRIYYSDPVIMEYADGEIYLYEE